VTTSPPRSRSGGRRARRRRGNIRDPAAPAPSGSAPTPSPRMTKYRRALGPAGVLVFREHGSALRESARHARHIRRRASFHPAELRGRRPFRCASSGRAPALAVARASSHPAVPPCTPASRRTDTSWRSYKTASADAPPFPRVPGAKRRSAVTRCRL
jgi:hypothetical protein